MIDFNTTVDELYKLCRRVQKETDNCVSFNIVNYKSGKMLSISIYDGTFESGKEAKIYSICENGYQEEENTQKAREHLNKLLLNKPCPYCEVNEDDK